MEKRCDDYLSIVCLNSGCPVVNYSYFMGKGMPDMAKAFADAGNCNDCILYQGCEYCLLADTEYCQDNKGDQL